MILTTCDDILRVTQHPGGTCLEHEHAHLLLDDARCGLENIAADHTAKADTPLPVCDNVAQENRPTANGLNACIPWSLRRAFINRYAS